jgi:hypothetical protein
MGESGYADFFHLSFGESTAKGKFNRMEGKVRHKKAELPET